MAMCHNLPIFGGTRTSPSLSLAYDQASLWQMPENFSSCIRPSLSHTVKPIVWRLNATFADTLKNDGYTQNSKFVGDMRLRPDSCNLCRRFSCREGNLRQTRAMVGGDVGEASNEVTGNDSEVDDESDADYIPVVPLSDLALGMNPEDEPWLGSILFRRSNVQTQYNFKTTLERLGLDKFSSKVSEELANATGIKLSDEFKKGTPVNVSCDVERVGNDLRVAGIVRSAVSLGCKRCLEPAGARFFADFDLILSATPVEEPTQKSLGVVLDGPQRYSFEGGDEGGGDSELDLDMDDRLYFPPESRQMDISKYIRDVIHLEAPMYIVCKASCRGLCLLCGVNLNKSDCRCKKKSKPINKKWDVLEQIKLQIEEKGDKTGGD